MPVEIRELIIKTEILSAGRNTGDENRQRDLHILKKKLLEECRKIISANIKRDYKR